MAGWVAGAACHRPHMTSLLSLVTLWYNFNSQGMLSMSRQHGCYFTHNIHQANLSLILVGIAACSTRLFEQVEGVADCSNLLCSVWGCDRANHASSLGRGGVFAAALCHQAWEI